MADSPKLVKELTNFRNHPGLVFETTASSSNVDEIFLFPINVISSSSNS